MCLGLPMLVLESGPGFALCDWRGERRRIDLALVGDQKPGTWLLTFLDAAREVITEAHAALIVQALDALDLAMSGADPASLDHLFPDLAGREPELPAHLRPDATH
jgi:hydrogenase expression/formation protein HypC